jgi:hypothetical protein
LGQIVFLKKISSIFDGSPRHYKLLFRLANNYSTDCLLLGKFKVGGGKGLGIRKAANPFPLTPNSYAIIAESL